jgi:hypothetical protein
VAQFVDYDPLRGVEQWEDRTIGGNMQWHYRQDVEPILELAKYERLNGLADKAGKEAKQDIYLYARIPPVVILKLKYEYGIDVFKRDHMKRAMEIINRDFPHLKCTDKHHALRN